jgi:hypothetical protein
MTVAAEHIIIAELPAVVEIFGEGVEILKPGGDGVRVGVPGEVF